MNILEKDLIVDTVSRLLGGDYFMPVVNQYESHSITDKFRYATFFPYARSVSPAEEKPEGITVETIAKSSQNSWSERQLQDQEVTFSEEGDVGGPISLAVVAKIQLRENQEEDPEGEPTELEEESTGPEDITAKSEGRIAVFGDSDFLADTEFLNAGNQALALNTFNWLVARDHAMGIPPRQVEQVSLYLTGSQLGWILLLILVILPGAVVLIGIIVWRRRRR